MQRKAANIPAGPKSDDVYRIGYSHLCWNEIIPQLFSIWYFINKYFCEQTNFSNPGTRINRAFRDFRWQIRCNGTERSEETCCNCLPWSAAAPGRRTSSSCRIIVLVFSENHIYSKRNEIKIFLNLIVPVDLQNDIVVFHKKVVQSVKHFDFRTNLK